MDAFAFLEPVITRARAVVLASSPVEPDGTRWRVRIGWAPRWWVDTMAVAVVVAAAAAAVTGFPALLVVPALLAGAILLLVRRPWRVTATSDRGDGFTEHTVGWRKAARRRALVSYFLTRGLRPDQ
ncbi:MAG TPA: hypothetical protein VF054_00370 [Micromonosporaceae bacterium]